MTYHRHPTAVRRTLVAALVTLVSVPALAQSFVVKPGARVLAGEPMAVALEGLPAAAEVELKAWRQVPEFTGGQRLYASSARFKVGADGRIDLAVQAPLSGSWQGADVRGAFWSMTPAPAAAAGTAPALSDVTEVELEAYVDGRRLARQRVTLLPALPEVQTRPAEPFAGAVFSTLPGGGKRPALILLGGSEGGTMITRDAPRFASRGYAVLALPYYSPQGFGPTGPVPSELPSLPAAFADIPIDRLEEARAWLEKQPEVDAGRIGIVGTSKGAELALLAGVRMPWLKAIAGIVPSDVVWEGWGPGVAGGQRSSFAWQGKPLPFVPYQDFEAEFKGFMTGEPVRIRRPHDKGRTAHADRVEAARIPVEKIAAPVFVAGAHDDQIWDSGRMAEAIGARRAQAGLETVALVFPEAGHYLGGTGLAPTALYNAGPMKSGGTPVANARAQAEVFGGLLAFLARQLQPAR